MRSRSLASLVASLAVSVAPPLAAAVAALVGLPDARAQAPGEVAPAPGGAPSDAEAPGGAPPPYAAPPYGAPPYAMPPAGAPPVSPAMRYRWTIGVALGGGGVRSTEAPEGSETMLRVGELALRYRASRRLELELGLAGGQEEVEGEAGELAMGSASLALRYRFRPEHRWGWYLVGGLGGLVIAQRTSTDAERDGATRPFALYGVGVERRFERLALHVELRGLAIGPREDSGDRLVAGDRPTAPRDPVGLWVSPEYADELTAATIAVGASYSF